MTTKTLGPGNDGTAVERDGAVPPVICSGGVRLRPDLDCERQRIEQLELGEEVVKATPWVPRLWVCHIHVGLQVIFLSFVAGWGVIFLGGQLAMPLRCFQVLFWKDDPDSCCSDDLFSPLVAPRHTQTQPDSYPTESKGGEPPAHELWPVERSKCPNMSPEVPGVAS